MIRLAPAALFLAALTVLSAEWARPSVAQEFRIESQIYDENSNLPISQNVTLFSEGLVYDFQLSDDAQPQPVEIVIFNSRTRLMVLLDVQRELRMELHDLRLLKLFDGVRRETSQDQRTKFLIDDAFSEDTDWSSGWVTMTSPSITYRFKGEQPKDLTVMPLYYEFLDNFTRLIATDPQRVPPFARVKLNQSLKRKGWLPTEIQLSVKQNDLFQQSFKATSKHVMVTELSKKDRERIADAKRQWMAFEKVNLTEYRGLKKSRPAPTEKIASALGKLKPTD